MGRYFTRVQPDAGPKARTEGKTHVHHHRAHLETQACTNTAAEDVFLGGACTNTVAGDVFWRCGDVFFNVVALLLTFWSDLCLPRGVSELLQTMNFIIRVGVLPTDTHTAPGSGGVHCHTWGPPGSVAGTQSRNRPERDPTKIKKLKPVFPTVPRKQWIYDEFLGFSPVSGR